MRAPALLAVLFTVACGQRAEEPAPSVVPVAGEAPSNPAPPQPLGVGGTVTVAGAETVAEAAGAPAGTEAATPTGTETETESAAGAEGEQARVRVTRAVCGDQAARGGARELQLGSRRRDRSLRIQIRDLTYYCSPPPRFSARVDGDTLEVGVLAPPPGTPVARCVCPHDADLTIDEIPENVTTVRLTDHREGAVLLESPVGRPLAAGSRERR